MSYLHDGIELVTPLHLKERIVGKHSIAVSTIKAGEKVTIVSMRSMIMSGLKSASGKFDCDLRVHKLLADQGDGEPGRLWTSDVPEEIYSQARTFSNAFGNVLVGGLGIGMSPVMIANLQSVKSVTVVEIEPEIIKLVADQLPKTRAPITIVKADLLKYLKRKSLPKFDFAFYDIWAGTGESTWMSDIVPLYRATFKAFGELKIAGWQFSDMAGQVHRALNQFFKRRKLMKPSEIEDWKQHWRVTGAFFNAAKKYGWSDYVLTAWMDFYSHGVGTQKWEDYFGESWDRYRKSRRRKNGA